MPKYKTWYDNIIYNAKNRILSGYKERHHIIPRSLGGSDEKSNLVNLTAREHFICHVLLTKFTEGRDRYKMLHASIMMKASSNGQNRYINSRLYDCIRKEYSKVKKGVHNNSWNTGLTKDTSDKLRFVSDKISESTTGLRHWTNGIIDRKSFESPGDGWIIGRAPNENFKLTDEEKLIRSERLSNGVCNWWNNGIINKRSLVSPGNDWVRGRLLGESKFLKDKSYLIKYNTFKLKNIITEELIILSFDEFKTFKNNNKIGKELKPRKRSHDRDVIWVLIEKT